MKKKILLPILSIAIMAIMLLTITLATAGIAGQNAQEEHLWVMQTLLPGSKNFTVEPYDGEDANIRSVHKGENGFVIETVTRGYAGDIVMLIGVSSEGKVTGLTIRDMQETAGLGMSAMWDWEFLGQFLNTEGGIAIGTAGEDAFSGVTGLTIRDMQETAGLGMQAMWDEQFLAQFLNTEGGVAIGTAGEDAFSGATGSDTTETETYVDGISGATVTSKAIARCVNSAVAYVTGADVDSGATSWGG